MTLENDDYVKLQFGSPEIEKEFNRQAAIVSARIVKDFKPVSLILKQLRIWELEREIQELQQQMKEKE